MKGRHRWLTIFRENNVVKQWSPTVPEDELQAVDLFRAEEGVGPNGEKLRKMIGDTYHCASKEEEDYYLRRFIASYTA